MSDEDKLKTTPLDDAELVVKRSIVTLYEALVLAQSLGYEEEQKSGQTYFGPEVSYAMLTLRNITSGSRPHDTK